MPSPPRPFCPAELAEAAAWTAGRGMGWRTELLHTNAGATKIGICRPGGHSEGIDIFLDIFHAEDEISFQVERTEEGIAVFNRYSETVGVFTTIPEALKAGVAAYF